MSLFERDPRVQTHGGPIWAMNIGEAYHGKRRRLIFGFRRVQRAQPDMEVWVEEERPEYYYIVDDPRARPKGTPRFRMGTYEFPKSRMRIDLKQALEWLLVSALGNDQIIGEAADLAVHNLFYNHFIDDDKGLSYLCKYAVKSVGDHHARDRLHKYTDYEKYSDGHEVWSTAIDGIEEATRNSDGYVTELGSRACRLVKTDATLRDAIEAVLLTTDELEEKHRHILDMVQFHMTPTDHVIAAIVSSTRTTAALLGVRACQRAETDQVFHDGLYALVQSATKKRNDAVYKFLRTQFKGQKL